MIIKSSAIGLNDEIFLADANEDFVFTTSTKDEDGKPTVMKIFVSCTHHLFEAIREVSLRSKANMNYVGKDKWGEDDPEDFWVKWE